MFILKLRNNAKKYDGKIAKFYIKIKSISLIFCFLLGLCYNSPLILSLLKIFIVCSSWNSFHNFDF